jgi:hypothetical protein
MGLTLGLPCNSLPSESKGRFLENHHIILLHHFLNMGLRVYQLGVFPRRLRHLLHLYLNRKIWMLLLEVNGTRILG